MKKEQKFLIVRQTVVSTKKTFFLTYCFRGQIKTSVIYLDLRFSVYSLMINKKKMLITLI